MLNYLQTMETLIRRRGMPHSAASDLGLHCLPITLLGVSRLQWVKVTYYEFSGNGLLGLI